MPGGRAVAFRRTVEFRDGKAAGEKMVSCTVEWDGADPVQYETSLTDA